MNLKNRLDIYKKNSKNNFSVETTNSLEFIKDKKIDKNNDENKPNDFTLPEKNFIEKIQSRFSKHPQKKSLSFSVPENIYISEKKYYNAKELLFFDLETTGLGSGPNTYAFIVGFGLFHENEFTVKQFFLPSPGLENVFLKEILEQYTTENEIRKTLVSFNGKSYDLPLLKRRMQHTLNISLSNRDHIDLYPLLKKIFPQKPSRLLDAENKILGFSRTDDLSGKYAPQAYFEFLKFGHDEKVKRIMRHNAIDIASLGSLILKVHAAIVDSHQGNLSWAPRVHRLEGSDIWKKQLLVQQKDRLAIDHENLGILYRRGKEYHRAVISFLRAAKGGRGQSLVHGVRLLAFRLNKQKSAKSLIQYGYNHFEAGVQQKLWEIENRLQGKTIATPNRLGKGICPYSQNQKHLFLNDRLP